jgi:YVTN family beta-propeller protein
MPIANHPRNLVYDPADHLVYLGTQQTGGVEGLPPSIAVINGTTILGYIAADCSADLCPMVYDASNGMLYVGNSGSGTVSVVNGTSVESILKVGPGPFSLIFNPYNNMIYVAVEAYGLGNKVAVIGGTEVVNVTVGSGPIGFIYDNSTGDVYVVNEGDTTLSVIRDTSNIANVILGFTPRFGVYNPSNGFVYVPDEDGHGVAIISGTTVVTNVVTGPSPDAIFFNPANNYIYVSNAGFVGVCAGCPFEPSDNVSIISGSRVLENVTVSWHPGSMLSEQRTGSVFVLTWGGIGLIAGPGSTRDSMRADTTQIMPRLETILCNRAH